MLALRVVVDGDNASITLDGGAPFAFTRPLHLAGLNQINLRLRNNNGTPAIDNLNIVDNSGA